MLFLEVFHLHIKEFLENVCNEIKYKPIRNDISEELALHIEEVKQDYIAEGLTEEAAEEKAVLNMGNAEEIGKKLNKIHRPKLDWILLILVAILIGFGMLVISIKYERLGGVVLKDFVLISLSLILSLIVYFFDYRKIKKYSNLIYVCSTVLIVLSLLFGYTLNGSYVYLNGISMMNICTCMYLIAFAGFVCNIKDDKFINIEVGKIKIKFNIDIIKLFVTSIFSIILLSLITPFAMPCILAISYWIISISAIINSKKEVKNKLSKFLISTLIIGLIFVLFVLLAKPGIFYKFKSLISRSYESDLRFNGWMGLKISEVLDEAKLTSGLDNMETYQGLFDGGTNYALITIIAYCGTLYSAIIIVTVILLCMKLIWDCKNIKDNYGKLLIVALSSIILLQACLNILMNLNLVPIMDINLPFVSYGMNGLFVNMQSIALILSIYRRKDILFKDVNKNKKLKLKIYFE